MSGGLRERLGRLKGSLAASKPAEPLQAEETENKAASQETDAEEKLAAKTGESLAAGDKAEDHSQSDGNDGTPSEGSESRSRPRLHPAFERLGVEQAENEYGAFLLRRTAYPLEYRHGHYALGELAECAAALGPMAARQNPAGGDAAAVSAERLLLLDTETTGLGVGAGNVPFMVGIGYLDAAQGRLVVEQTLIRHPGEEKAMLQYLLGRMGGRSHLATFNGRTFDWPLLASRYILNGWRRSGPEPGHLDFLHPSRALWRNTLESCRLSRIEEERLGIGRHEDVPGSLAPELYFGYLGGGDASLLEGVFLHNERDVLTLATLAVHFARLLSEPDGDAELPTPGGAEELFRTASWLETHGMADKAERLFRALAARDDPAASRWWLKTALRYKKLGLMEPAVELWRRCAERAENAAYPHGDAHVELAMHFEHRLKDYEEALRWAETALELTLRRPVAAGETGRTRQEREELRHRIERLRRKAGRR